MWFCPWFTICCLTESPELHLLLQAQVSAADDKDELALQPDQFFALSRQRQRLAGSYSHRQPAPTLGGLIS